MERALEEGDVVAVAGDGEYDAVLEVVAVVAVAVADELGREDSEDDKGKFQWVEDKKKKV